MQYVLHVYHPNTIVSYAEYTVIIYANIPDGAWRSIIRVHDSNGSSITPTAILEMSGLHPTSSSFATRSCSTRGHPTTCAIASRSHWGSKTTAGEPFGIKAGSITITIHHGPQALCKRKIAEEPRRVTFLHGPFQDIGKRFNMTHNMLLQYFLYINFICDWDLRTLDLAQQPNLTLDSGMQTLCIQKYDMHHA